MKIGVISDTHDNIEKAGIAFSFFERNVEVVFHLGDIVSPFLLRVIRERYKGIIYGVFGNNDGDYLFLDRHIREYGWKFSPIPQEIELEGDKFFLMHEPLNPEALLLGGNYKGVFFGHTHERFAKRSERGIILNPGEACGYLGDEPTCAVLDKESLEVQWVFIDRLGGG